jgi:hypothetical protein
VSFTAETNLKSIAVMERLGMVRDLAADFEHPAVPVGHRVRPHVLYRLSPSALAGGCPQQRLTVTDPATLATLLATELGLGDVDGPPPLPADRLYPPLVQQGKHGVGVPDRRRWQ